MPTFSQEKGAKTVTDENRRKLAQLVPKIGIGENWPEAVVSAVVNSKDPKEMVERIGPALEEIAEVTGRKTDYVFSSFEEPEIAELFVKYPNEFVEIAKATGGGAGTAFYRLGNPDIAKMFVENPQLVISSFKGIVEAVGEDIGRPPVPIASDALYTLGNPDIAKMFVENPQLVISSFGEIVEATGGSAGDAFFTFWNHPDIVKLFVDYCEGRCEFDRLILSMPIEIKE